MEKNKIFESPVGLLLYLLMGENNCEKVSKH